VVSWNVQRVAGGIAELARGMEEKVDWGAILVQELFMAEQAASAPGWEASLGGHMLFVNDVAAYDTTVIVHRRWAGRVRLSRSSRYATLVRLRGDGEGICLVAAHQPTEWGADEDAFEQAAAELGGDASRGSRRALSLRRHRRERKCGGEHGPRGHPPRPVGGGRGHYPRAVGLLPGGGPPGLTRSTDCFASNVEGTATIATDFFLEV